MEIELLGFIDRFEGDLAVIKCHGKELIIPATLLPENTCEGNWVEMNIKVRKDLEDKTRDEVLKLLDKLRQQYDE